MDAFGRTDNDGAVAALQAEAGAEDAGFDPARGRVARRRPPDIQPGDVDPLAGRDANADQDAEEEAEHAAHLADNEDLKALYDAMTPEEVFMEFDVDGSGFIDLAEFKDMLPKLGVKMSSAKALKYFKMCDTDGSGEIDFEEFKVALYACDPNSGNPIGFAPNNLLTPKDAFEMFDEDGSGKVDEDEFFFVLEYLQLDVPDEKQDRLFSQYDADGSGFIDYDEFKQIWLNCCDVKKELLDREITPPKFATKGQLIRILEKALGAEEEAEKRALAEADRWRKWQLILNEKKRMIAKALRRSKLELRTALDAAGQVYTLGSGTYNQFAGDVVKDISSKNYRFEGFSEVYDLWHGRIYPGESFLAKDDDDNQKRVSGKQQDEKLEIGKNISVEDPRVELMTSPFREVTCATNTAALWGRRICQVALCENVAVALSDLGELYSWGGQSHWWHEVEEDAVWQTQWRGDTTARSSTLLMTMKKDEPVEDAIEIKESEEDLEAEKYKVVTTYYAVWSAPPQSDNRLVYYKDVLVPKIPYESLKLSLETRCKAVEQSTKFDMCDMVYRDILLEKKVLGERAHRRIREMEEEVVDLRKRRKKAMAKKLILDIQEMWEPLKHMQSEEDAEAIKKAEREIEEKHVRGEQNYVKWRKGVQEGREDMNTSFSARGNSLDVQVSGITARGQQMKTPRGYAKAVAVTCGSSHASLVHENGQLYTWGMGASGRLGLDLTEDGDPSADAPKPTLVQALAGRPVVRASCGYAHSAAVTVDARLFVWGSGATGKLGLGAITDQEECFCSVPTPLVVGKNVRVRKVSCGSAHTACITDKGELFVWGCGDGGRLGLGSKRMATLYRPSRVEALAGKKIVSVSCGNSHTLCSTAVREVWQGEGSARVKVKVGGDVFEAGPLNVLGRFCPSFEQVSASRLDELAIIQVSAGFTHSGAVSASGELFCWGNNSGGCCGAPTDVKFCNEPYNVRCLFERPVNLALGKPAKQCSVYSGLDAYLAVDGNVEGVRHIALASHVSRPKS